MPLFKLKIKGNSMEPTFYEGDTVLVSRLSYLFKKPKIGDTVLLKRERYIIKRITQVNCDQFFVEGDNKEESKDSRNFGWVLRKEIVGKVVLKLS